MESGSYTAEYVWSGERASLYYPGSLTPHWTPIDSELFVFVPPTYTELLFYAFTTLLGRLPLPINWIWNFQLKGVK